MGMPWLTVAMTTYNAREYIGEALDSVIAQADDDVEVVVVDDASSDNTHAILKKYRSQIPLRIIARHRNTANWMAGLNTGIRMARGKYVCFLQHDDYWLPGRLQAIRETLERSPDLALLLHPARFVDRYGKTLGTWRCPLPKNRLLPSSLVAERLLIQNFVAMPAPIFRKEVALSVGGLDETLWYSADWDFWLKLALVGSTYYMPRPLSAYRIHHQSMTWWRTDSQILEQKRQLQVVLDRFAPLLVCPSRHRPKVRSAADFSIEVNSRLASRIHGQSASLTALLPQFLALGPRGWHRFLRDSRITERVAARMRARMHRWHLAPGAASSMREPCRG